MARTSALLFVLAAASVGAADGQSAACPDFAEIPGVSAPEDRTLPRCRARVANVATPDVSTLPEPVYARAAHGSLVVVVEPDGTVSRALTRGRAASDLDHLHRLVDALAGLAFPRGTVAGEPTRYGFVVGYRTDTRSDSIAETLTWRYVAGEEGDSLIGRWTATGATASPGPEDVRTALVGATRALLDQRVLVPEQGIGYCVIFRGEEPARTVRDELTSMANGPHRRGSGAVGCERDVGVRRYVLGGPSSSGGGRLVVHASGDYYETPSLEGRVWQAWEAYCVVPPGKRPRCEIVPSSERYVPSRLPIVPEAESPDEPVSTALQVVVGDAARHDTIRGTAPFVPSLETYAVRSSGEGLCRWLTSTDARAERASGTLVVRLDVGDIGPDAWVTPVRELRTERPDARVGCPERSARPYALFTLSDEPDDGSPTIEVCIGGSGCPYRHELTPDHRYPLEPVADFTLENLTHGGSGEPGGVSMRLTVDRAIWDLRPLLVVRLPEGEARMPLEAWLMARRGTPRVFLMSLGRSPAYPPGTRFSIYLVRVPSS